VRPKTTEKALIQKAMQGDTAAFGEIIEKYQDLVYAKALQITRDPIGAQDVTQDAFISAFKGFKDLRSDSSFLPWLRKITRNLALSWLRERKRLRSLEEANVLPSSFEPLQMEIEDEQRETEAFQKEIGKVVASLSDSLRFPILLCYLNGISTAEAAHFLGLKEGTLRKRLHDGKKKLQEKVVKMAEKTLQEYRLPSGFAKRCICGCERAQFENKRREVMKMAKKGGCGCGCGCVDVSSSKKEKPKPKKSEKK
jgi:RNA polymerase sigma factor (sigma-70 family)